MLITSTSDNGEVERCEFGGCELERCGFGDPSWKIKFGGLIWKVVSWETVYWKAV